MYAAERFVREQGWSVGPTDVTGLRGILFRPGVLIAKWKNLTLAERAQCDAVMASQDGNRHGSVTIAAELVPKRGCA